MVCLDNVHVTFFAGTAEAKLLPMLEKKLLNSFAIALISFISCSSLTNLFGMKDPFDFKVIICLMPFQIFLIFDLFVIKYFL